jgi:hypothetical protein
MDAWPEHSGWAKEAAALIRDRFLTSTMTAMLELACPVSLTARTFRREQPKRSRKRTLVSISTTSYKEVQRAVTLLREACKRQKEELGEARTVWEKRTGRRLGADGRDDELLSCLRLESRSKDVEQLTAEAPIDRLTLFEQALSSWTRGWGTTPILHSLFPDAWPGIRIVEVNPKNPRPNEFLAT